MASSAFSILHFQFSIQLMSEEPHKPRSVQAIILAAGQGTRMKSALPKMLHTIGGTPLIEHCVRTTTTATGTEPVIVIGHGAEAVSSVVNSRARFAMQAEQSGTGHAVLQAEMAAQGVAQVTVSYGDMPLLKPETLRRLMALQAQTGAAVTVLTLVTGNTRGFGRIVRDGAGEQVLAIVEEVACTPAQLTINEVNVGVYAFDGAWLWDALKRIKPNPQKGEYFLTDVVEAALADGREVRAVTSDDADECIGINTRADLADAEAALRRRINRRHMLNGVTLTDPATAYIEDGVEIGSDTVIHPNTFLRGQTRIGNGCRIGPNTQIIASAIGNDVEIIASVIEHSVIEDGVLVGPFAHFRPGARVCAGAHVGNFAEIKNSTLGPGSHMGHFSYLGDATAGEGVNIGAGVITCNFDGAQKNHTTIGDGAFVGSDTLLVAPVTIGRGARTGAGAVVTKDVPADALAVGMPARVIKTWGS
jgi:bifunctional UDP-N-acetylglucosamine pyrophosphorylase/glucosamine-1-phosphate N-acetyltransferase